MNLSNKKHKKTAAAGAILLAIMLTVSACGVNSGNQERNEAQNQDEAPAPTDKLPEDNGVIEPGSPDDSEEDNNNGGESPAEEAKSAEGVYTGQIDANSVEITTESGAAAYRIPEELTTVIENLPSDAKVKFKYTEKAVDGVKQLWLTMIEAVQ